MGGTCIRTAELVGAVAGAFVVAVCLACAAARCSARRAASSIDEEEAKFRAAVEALRDRLLLTRPEGFFLNTDRLSTWRSAVCKVTGKAAAGAEGVIYLQRSHLEAATRLGLLRDDADAKLVNALCVCVHGRPVQERRLSDWLLEVSRGLLDPTLPAGIPAPAANSVLTSATMAQSNSISSSWGDLALLPVGSAESGDSRLKASKSSFRRESAVVDEDEHWRRARFRYFQEKVAKVWVCLPMLLRRTGGES
jgi:hypothetical protein